MVGLQNIGWSGLILILVALLLVFGPSKLPEIGKAFGKSLREFKEATRGMIDDASDAARGTKNHSNTVHSAAVNIEPIELKEEQSANIVEHSTSKVE